jgi:hypothetical protein
VNGLTIEANTGRETVRRPATVRAGTGQCMPTARASRGKGDPTMFAAFHFRHATTALAAVLLLSTGTALAQSSHTSRPFTGAKVNGGTVTHSIQGKAHVLTLSTDFQVPDTPDPHWQVVDSRGNVYLLQRLGIKGDKINKTITLPAYVSDVAKVQIYCAWAEALLGEAPFASPQKTH